MSDNELIHYSWLYGSTNVMLNVMPVLHYTTDMYSFRYALYSFKYSPTRCRDSLAELL